MNQSFYFYANPYQSRSEEAARALLCSLEKRGADVFSLPWLSEKGVGRAADESALPENIRAIIAFGGDGTLLRAAPIAAGRHLPLLGIHTGTIGFLMQGRAEDAEKTADLLLQETYPLKKQPMLEVIWEGQRFLALNDVSLTRGEHPGVVETIVLADDETVFRAHGDGAVISTPLGATAYSLAAGGPIVRPDTRCLLAVPVCARELLLRPVILPLDAHITLLASGHERRRLQLAIDGQLLFPIQKETQIEIKLAREQTLFISPRPDTFFQTLRAKQQLWNREEQE